MPKFSCIHFSKIITTKNCFEGKNPTETYWMFSPKYGKIQLHGSQKQWRGSIRHNIWRARLGVRTQRIGWDQIAAYWSSTATKTYKNFQWQSSEHFDSNVVILWICQHSFEVNRLLKHRHKAGKLVLDNCHLNEIYLNFMVPLKY